MRARVGRCLTATVVVFVTLAGLLVAGATPAAAHAARPVVTGLSVHSGSARGGTRLTVYGQHFTNVRSVVFSGVAAHDVHRLSSHRLRVTAPFWRLHPHPYVYVTTAAGSSKATRAARFTYHPVPPPTVRAMSTHFASNIGSTSIRIYGHNFFDVDRVEIGSRNAERVYRRSSEVLDVVLNPQATGIRYTRVTTRWGTSGGDAASRVQFVDPPSVSGLSAHGGSSGGDTHVSIYGKGLDHLVDVHFGSAPATQVTATSPTEIRVTTPAHAAGLVHAIVTTDRGSSERGVADRFRYGRPQRAHWSAPTEVDPVRGDPQALSCPTTIFCALVDRSGVVTYDGTTWHDTVVPVLGGWDGVQCHSSQLCIAWTFSGTVSVYRGTTWSPAAPVINGAIRAIDCLSDTFCRLTGTDTEYVFDGTSFAPTGDHLLGLIALQCSTETDCTALDSDGEEYQRTAESGWTQTGRVDVPDLVFASCSGDGGCLAVSDRGRTVVYDGTWHESSAGSFDPQAMTCAGADYCVAIDENGKARVRSGGEWSAGVPVLDSHFPVFLPMVACPAEQSCLVVDREGELYPFEHNVAGPDTTVDGPRGELGDISCAATSSCVALDRGRYATETHDGSSWTMPHPRIGSAVSCPTTTFCMAVGYRWATVFHGTSWSERTTLLDVNSVFRDISCPTSTFCLATVVDGRVTTWNGRTWSTPAKPLGAHIDLASCPAAGDCTAVTDTNDLVTLRSGTWRHGSQLTLDSQSFEDTGSIDCPDPQTCLITTDAGTVITAAASGVSYAYNVLSTLTDIDCASAQSCVAANAGEVALWDGSSWSTSVATPATVSSVSCPVAGHCVAAGDTDIETLDW